MIILVDMDDVLADFEGEFIKRWKSKHPDKICIEKEKRKIFGILSNYPVEYSEHIREIWNNSGFFRNLPVIDGSIDAINTMKEKGHEVFLCTAPIRSFQNCVNEKYEWVNINLGNDWTSRIILTRDKTLIKGDILIDDNPEIKGAAAPEWEHILYDMPYNRDVIGKKRLTWENWKDVIEI